MWKVWKKEIIGITLASILIICALTVFTLKMRENVEHHYDYKPHVMVDGVTYWDTGKFIAALPEGYAECAVVEEDIGGRRAEKDSQAAGYSVGSKIYCNSQQPGQVYIAQAYNRFHRLTITELQGSFLRYNGELYISRLSIPYELDPDSISYDPKQFSPTGETVSWPGDKLLLPTEDCTTNSSTFSGGEICLNPQQPELLVVKLTIQMHTQTADTRTDYHVFVTTDSLGLDYSAYEWD